MADTTNNAYSTGAINITPPTPDGTGYLGGSQRTANDHPFLSGNLYIYFGFPSNIIGDGNKASDFQGTLLTAAEEYTPHADAQIKIVDVEGQGGVGASFISGRTNTREFSITYKDFWGAPIFRIHRKWCFINPYLGGSDMSAEVDGYAANEYKGICMVIQTKPVARGSAENLKAWHSSDIIKIAYYDGVFPKVDLSSVYAANITDSTLIKPNVSYSFDGTPLDETYNGGELKIKAAELLENQHVFAQIADTYSKLIGDVENGLTSGQVGTAPTTI